MSHAIYLSDDVYKVIEQYATEQGKTPEAAIGGWLETIKEEIVQSRSPSPETSLYDPTDDPLAEFLGTGELTESV